MKPTSKNLEMHDHEDRHPVIKASREQRELVLLTMEAMPTSVHISDVG